MFPAEKKKKTEWNLHIFSLLRRDPEICDTQGFCQRPCRATPGSGLFAHEVGRIIPRVFFTSYRLRMELPLSLSLDASSGADRISGVSMCSEFLSLRVIECTAETGFIGPHNIAFLPVTCLAVICNGTRLIYLLHGLSARIDTLALVRLLRSWS